MIEKIYLSSLSINFLFFFSSSPSEGVSIVWRQWKRKISHRKRRRGGENELTYIAISHGTWYYNSILMKATIK